MYFNWRFLSLWTFPNYSKEKASKNLQNHLKNGRFRHEFFCVWPLNIWTASRTFRHKSFRLHNVLGSRLNRSLDMRRELLLCSKKKSTRVENTAVVTLWVFVSGEGGAPMVRDFRLAGLPDSCPIKRIKRAVWYSILLDDWQSCFKNFCLLSPIHHQRQREGLKKKYMANAW